MQNFWRRSTEMGNNCFGDRWPLEKLQRVFIDVEYANINARYFVCLWYLNEYTQNILR